MKLLRIIAVFALLSSAFFSHPAPLKAAEPNRDYLLNQMFGLYMYVPPRSLIMHENRERRRTYEDIGICGIDWFGDLFYSGKYPGNADLPRKCESSNECVGEVTLCANGGSGGAVRSQTDHGSCNYSQEQADEAAARGEKYFGRCEYKSRPQTQATMTSTDFSLPQTPLTYPKYQSEANAYNYTGTDNSITWGSMDLSLSFCDRAERQLSVLAKAHQTFEVNRTTVSDTAKEGEWPLGWVDWEYKTKNGKTLLEIWKEVDAHDPGGNLIKGPIFGIIQAKDNYYKTVGAINEDTSGANTRLCQTLKEHEKESWVQDVLQAPLYPQSVRHGYGRTSICVWAMCFPNPEILITIPDWGHSVDVYSDSSVQPTFAAALDNLFLSYPLSQALDIYKSIVFSNPAIRFATMATEEAIPDKIAERLDAEGVKKYLAAISMGDLGHVYDYQHKMDSLGYTIQPVLDKQTAGSLDIVESNLIQMLYYKMIDNVDDVKLHFITLPDILGQSLYRLQDPVYRSRDTLTNLGENYLGYSNIVDDGAGNKWYGGKGLSVSDAKRRLAYFSCADSMYSVPGQTSVEQYALGTRIGCNDSQNEDLVPGTCDGKLFAKLLENSGGVSTSPTSTANSFFASSIKPNLTPELMKTYALAEQKTGVPCEILAGIHFVEADLNPSGSLVSGRPLGTEEPDAGGAVFGTLLDTAIHAGNELKGKAGGSINSVPSAITALSRYNGGGNSNCQAGYPYPIPYGGCPRAFEGEDDPYPTNWLDAKHSTMYLLYCADYTACVPQVFERPGSFTVALAVYEQITKNGNTDFANATPAKPGATKPTGNATSNTGGGGFFPKSCGAGTLSTGLGCIPYTYETLVPALFRFLVGLSGGVAVVVMLFGVFQIMTAGDDPKKLQKGKELFTSAVVGLLFLIFSVSLLRIIAGSIIKIPGF